MTQRRLLEARLKSLGESGEIIRSMKNLAFMETRKLQRTTERQQGIVERIDSMASDFLSFHPQALPVTPAMETVALVIGTRRGFCGDFNERVLSRLESDERDTGWNPASVIGVGSQLCRRLEPRRSIDASLAGADVADEVPVVLSAVVRELDTLRGRYGVLRLDVIYCSSREKLPRRLGLLPPFEKPVSGLGGNGDPPLLNLAPRDFLVELGDQYLYAALQALLCESLLAENEQRLQHLDGAVRNLDKKVSALQRRVQSLRREEIIEEIEVILLNAAETAGPAFDTDPDNAA